MGRGLKIYRSQQAATGQTAGVKSNPGALSTSNADDIARSTQAMAESVADIADVSGKLAFAEQQVKLSGLTRQRETMFNQTMAALEAENNPDNHAKLIAEFQSQAQVLGGGLRGRAAQQWEKETNQRQPEIDAHLNYVSRKKRLAVMDADTMASWQQAAADKDDVSLKRIADSRVAAGLWTGPVAAAELATATRQIGAARVQDVLTQRMRRGEITLAQATDQLLSGDSQEIVYPGGIKKSYQIDADTRGKMARELLFWDTQQKQAAAEAQRAAFEAGDKEAFLSFSDNSLTHARLETMVREGGLSTADAWHYRQALKGEEEKARVMAKLDAEAQAEAAKTDLGQQLYGALMTGKLTEDDITRMVSVDKVLTDDEGNKWKGWIAAKNKSADVETDIVTRWDIKEKIHGVAMGRLSAESVRADLKRAALTDKKLSKTDAGQLQDELYQAVESSAKNNLNPTAASLKEWGMTQLKTAHKEKLFGDLDKPETQVLFDQRMRQWEQYWKQNPEATQEDAEQFAAMLMEPQVKSNLKFAFSRFAYITPMTGIPMWLKESRKVFNGESLLSTNVNERIDAELGRTAAGQVINQFVLTEQDKAPAGGPVIDPNKLEVGQTMERDGVIYTYVGDGKWEYD